MSATSAFILAERSAQDQLMAYLDHTPDVNVELLSNREEALNCGALRSESSCLLLGNRLGPHTLGLDLIDELREKNDLLQCILVCENPTLQHAVAAYRAGIVEFIQLPMESHLIVSSVHRAIALQRRMADKRDAERRFQKLAEAEYRVISLMLRGFTNRRIASRMKMGVRTVERARSRILKKIGVDSLFEVARLHGLAFNDDTFPASRQTSWTTGLQRSGCAA